MAKKYAKDEDFAKVPGSLKPLIQARNPTMKHAKRILVLLAAATAFQAARAQTYRYTASPFESGTLETKGSKFEIATVSNNGNLCNLEGSLKNNVFRENGCEIRFTFSRGKATVSIPEAASEACRSYCGLNAGFAGDYRTDPAACTAAGIKRTEQRFQAAYRSKDYAQAAKIKQNHLNACTPFLFITEQMRAINDLAVSHKNSGNKAACLAALQPLHRYWNDTAEEHSYIYRDAFMKELSAAKFNQAACE